MDTSAADLGILMIVETHVFVVQFKGTARTIRRIRDVLICLFLSKVVCCFVFTGMHCFIS